MPALFLRLCCRLFPLLLVTQPVRADLPDLTRLSLEELMNLEVALVARHPERLATTPAAVAVLTREDLRRAGTRHIPAALRLVPGMQVARLDANKWVVTSRGFAGIFANKLLVLIDGRSVYTPLFSGVFWESQDVVFEDVERIEVIRGPGGALWGTNAVNGIINIVTRSAATTQGWLAEVGGGTTERYFTTLRYGGRRREGLYFRAYAKLFSRAQSSRAVGQQPHDEWDFRHGGARLDWQLSPRDSLSLAADLYTGQIGQSLFLVSSLAPPYTELLHTRAVTRGSSLTGRWERRLATGSQLALNLYLDRAERREAVLRGTIHTADTDFQCRLQPAQDLEMIWGVGYRLVWDQFSGSFTMSLEPSRYTAQLVSGFLHGRFMLLPERLHLFLGTKLEHNAYSGLELQPNARLWWSPTPSHIFWAALSQAARIPSRSEHHFRGITQVVPPDSLFPNSPIALVTLYGDQRFDAEQMRGLEIGYRTLQGDLLIDLTAFYNRYTQVRTNELGLPFPADSPLPFHWLIPVRVANKGNGWTWGWEGTADWQRWSRWNLRAAYSYLRMRLKVDDDSLDLFTENYDGEIPRHQLSLRSHLVLASRLSLDATGRFVDTLPIKGIDRYLTLDIHLDWRLDENLELALVGRDLLDTPRQEYASSTVPSPPALIETSFYGVMTWKF